MEKIDMFLCCWLGTMQKIENKHNVICLDLIDFWELD